MKLIKIMYYVNLIILVILTITNYVYNDNIVFLVVMLLAYWVQLLSVRIEERRNREKNNNGVKESASHVEE